MKHPMDITMEAWIPHQIQVDQLQENVHELYKPRLPHSSSSSIFTHVRHGYYLNLRPFAYSGRRVPSAKEQGRPNHRRGTRRTSREEEAPPARRLDNLATLRLDSPGPTECTRTTRHLSDSNRAQQDIWPDSPAPFHSLETYFTLYVL